MAYADVAIFSMSHLHIPSISWKYPSKEALIADRQSSLWEAYCGTVSRPNFDPLERSGCVMYFAPKTSLFSQLAKPLFVMCQGSGSHSCFLIYTTYITLPSPFYLLSLPVFSPLPILFQQSPLLSRLLVRRHHCLFG